MGRADHGGCRTAHAGGRNPGGPVGGGGGEGGRGHRWLHCPVQCAEGAGGRARVAAVCCLQRRCMLASTSLLYTWLFGTHSSAACSLVLQHRPQSCCCISYRTTAGTLATRGLFQPQTGHRLARPPASSSSNSSSSNNCRQRHCCRHPHGLRPAASSSSSSSRRGCRCCRRHHSSSRASRRGLAAWGPQGVACGSLAPLPLWVARLPLAPLVALAWAGCTRPCHPPCGPQCPHQVACLPQLGPCDQVRA
jgi:hypothetical protein